MDRQRVRQTNWKADRQLKNELSNGPTDRWTEQIRTDEHTKAPQTNWKTDKQLNKWTLKWTNIPTDEQTNFRTDEQANTHYCWADKQLNRRTDKQNKKHTDEQNRSEQVNRQKDVAGELTNSLRVKLMNRIKDTQMSRTDQNRWTGKKMQLVSWQTAWQMNW